MNFVDIFLLENSLALGKQNTYNKPSYNKFIHITKWYSSRIGGGIFDLTQLVITNCFSLSLETPYNHVILYHFSLRKIMWKLAILLKYLKWWQNIMLPNSPHFDQIENKKWVASGFLYKIYWNKSVFVNFVW